MALHAPPKDIAPSPYSCASPEILAIVLAQGVEDDGTRGCVDTHGKGLSAEEDLERARMHAWRCEPRAWGQQAYMAAHSSPTPTPTLIYPWQKSISTTSFMMGRRPA